MKEDVIIFQWNDQLTPPVDDTLLVQDADIPEETPEEKLEPGLLAI